MRKAIKLIPIALLPYTIFVYVGLIYIFMSLPYEQLFNEKNAYLYSDDMNFLTLIICAALLLYSFNAAIFNSVITVKRNTDATEASIMNLFVKLTALPLFFIVFKYAWAVAFAGLFMFAIIPIIIIALGFIFLVSGINSLGCSIRMMKEKMLPNSICILLSIMSFFFFVDCITAIIYFIVCIIKEKSITKEKVKKCLCEGWHIFKMIPLIFLSSSYYILCALFKLLDKDLFIISPEKLKQAIFIIFVVSVLFVVTYHPISILKKKMSNVIVAQINLFSRVVLILSAIFKYYLISLGAHGNLFNIDFTVLVVSLIAISFFFININSICACIILCKSKVLSRIQATVFSVLSFIPGIDVIIGAVILFICSKSEKAVPIVTTDEIMQAI